MSPEPKIPTRIVAPLPRLQTTLHVSVCRFNQLYQRRDIHVTFRPEFHMTHELASAFQQTLGIGDLGAAKEPDIDMSLECIDITKCRIRHACGRMAIVQQLSNVVA